jgi:ketosteroid isomerase-like protein
MSAFNQLVCGESSMVSVRRGESMKEKLFRTRTWGNLVLIAVMGATWHSQAQDTKAEDKTYASNAPIDQYPMDRDAEITAYAPQSAAGPTKENALAAEQAIGQALLANDADAVSRLLDPDWAVINTDGGIGDGVRDGFCAAIKSGQFTRKTFVLDLPNARVRLYGNLALLTVKLATSGMIGGKPFDVKEVQTDVLKWEDGGWRSILTHETKVKEK